MTGRAYMGEVLTQVWLKSEMSELFDKQVNAQKEENFRGSRKLPQAHEKVCDENERKKEEKKRRALKNVIDGRRAFIGSVCKSGMIDCKEPQGDDC